MKNPRRRTPYQRATRDDLIDVLISIQRIADRALAEGNHEGNLKLIRSEANLALIAAKVRS